MRLEFITRASTQRISAKSIIIVIVIIRKAVCVFLAVACRRWTNERLFAYNALALHSQVLAVINIQVVKVVRVFFAK